MPAFYRVIKTNPPTRADFTSDKERGRLMPKSRELLRLWDGLSVFDTETRARLQSRRYDLGDYIAVVDIPEDGSIPYERTTRSEGHYTLWGDADQLMACVRSIVVV